jgi:glutamyl-Q tRNA(Asp) synthetase
MEKTRTEVVGRFAPSPTGPLHFGSLVAAVGSYCLARCRNGRWLLRMEDLDTPRVVPGAADDILRTLESFGLQWDGPVVWQSRRGDAYAQALESLRSKGLVFDCGCSRKEVLASAPHQGEEGPVYPGTCRKGLAPGRVSRALRVRVPTQEVHCFIDGIFGRCEQRLADAVGDFVLRRADGVYAYQLAVVVDDAAAGVTQVVRGADLLGSTARQIYLQQCLGYSVPRYYHLPLALSEDGEKISKRHGAVSVEQGADPSSMLCRVLRFLGQDLPYHCEKGTPQEILEWATKHFDVRKTPATGQVVV